MNKNLCNTCIATEFMCEQDLIAMVLVKQYAIDHWINLTRTIKRILMSCKCLLAGRIKRCRIGNFLSAQTYRMVCTTKSHSMEISENGI